MGTLKQPNKATKAEYYDRLSKNYADTNESRVLKTVTLETADGRMLLSEPIGSLTSAYNTEE